MRVVLLLLLAVAACASPLWDYVHKPDPNYAYFDTGLRLNNQSGSLWMCVLGVGAAFHFLQLAWVWCGGVCRSSDAPHQPRFPVNLLCCYCSGYVLNMTSQQWLDSSRIDRPIWTHQLVRTRAGDGKMLRRMSRAGFAAAAPARPSR